MKKDNRERNRKRLTQRFIKRTVISVLIYCAIIALFFVIANFVMPTDIQREDLDFDSGTVTETWVYKGPRGRGSTREYRFYFYLDNGKQYYISERRDFLFSIDLEALEGKSVTVGYSEYADYISDKHDGYVVVDIESEGESILSVESLNEYVWERYWRNRIGWMWGIFIFFGIILVLVTWFDFAYCYKIDLNVGGPMLTPKKKRSRPKKQYENKRR